MGIDIDRDVFLKVASATGIDPDKLSAALDLLRLWKRRAKSTKGGI